MNDEYEETMVQKQKSQLTSTGWGNRRPSWHSTSSRCPKSRVLTVLPLSGDENALSTDICSFTLLVRRLNGQLIVVCRLIAVFLAFLYMGLCCEDALTFTLALTRSEREAFSEMTLWSRGSSLFANGTRVSPVTVE